MKLNASSFVATTAASINNKKNVADYCLHYNTTHSIWRKSSHKSHFNVEISNNECSECSTMRDIEWDEQRKSHRKLIPKRVDS